MTTPIANRLSAMAGYGAVVAVGLVLAVSGCSAETVGSGSTAAGSATAKATAKAGTFAAEIETFKNNLPGALNGMSKDVEKVTATSYDVTYSDVKGNQVHVLLCEKSDDAACASAATAKEWKSYTVALTSDKADFLQEHAMSIFRSIIPA